MKSWYLALKTLILWLIALPGCEGILLAKVAEKAVPYLLRFSISIVMIMQPILQVYVKTIEAAINKTGCKVKDYKVIMEKTLTLQSTIICPKCSFHKEETMPADACQYFYKCTNCESIIKPKQGDCCVFCSYGTVACPPVQMNKSCCL